MTGRVWTISNALSFSRVLLLIPVTYLLLNPSPLHNLFTAVLVFLAGLTDLFDGMLARKLNQVSELGKIIDPLADKICVAVVTVIFAVQGKLPLWFLLLAVVRDIAIFFGGIYIKRRRGIIVASNSAGKWATAFISFLVLFTVLDLEPFRMVKLLFLLASTVMLIISAATYARRFQEIVMEWRE